MRTPVGFNFTEHMRRLCQDMTCRIAALRHIQMSRVGVGFDPTRSSSMYGVHATLSPLRCKNGASAELRNGQLYTLPKITAQDGTEYLYIINFLIPRFLRNPFKKKLITTVHELLHISPDFNGDIRRFQGRCYAHGGSQKKYDTYAEQLVDIWLAMNPPTELYDFLHLDDRGLRKQYGGIYGTTFPKIYFHRVKP